MEKAEKEKMNISQKKMYQRLIGILPDLDKQNAEIIDELLVQHILGISKNHRIHSILLQLGIDLEDEKGSDID
jgi:hypothetical protein